MICGSVTKSCCVDADAVLQFSQSSASLRACERIVYTVYVVVCVGRWYGIAWYGRPGN